MQFLASHNCHTLCPTQFVNSVGQRQSFTTYLSKIHCNGNCKRDAKDTAEKQPNNSVKTMRRIKFLKHLL